MNYINFVKKYKIDQCSGQEWEPQHIRHDEILTEWDIVINERVDDVVVVLDVLLQIAETHHVENAIQHDDQPVFILSDRLHGQMDTARDPAMLFVSRSQSPTFSF